MRQFFILFFSLFISSVSLAADNSGEQLSVLLKSYTTYQADFQQQTYSERGKLVQSARGVVMLQRPGKFRWETKTPTQQVIVADGNRLWIYDQDLAQVTVKNLSKMKTSDPAALLTGNVSELLQNFSVTQKTTSQDEIFTLTPKNSDGIFVQVVLQFRQKQLIRIAVTNSLGQVSRFTFDKIELNKKLNASLFSFKPEPGVDVLH